MEGIHYLVDDEGHRKAVVIDLDRHGELWEDFYDACLVEARETEPRAPLDAVKDRLRKAGRLARHA